MCSCNKNRRSQNAARGIQFVYDFTSPGAEEVTSTFGTPLEAKQAVRKEGGGTIRRRQVASAPAA